MSAKSSSDAISVKQKTVFSGQHFFFSSKYISIDSELSKTYEFERQNSRYDEILQKYIHIFTSQNIQFVVWKSLILVSCRQEEDPPPPISVCGHVHKRKFLKLIYTFPQFHSLTVLPFVPLPPPPLHTQYISSYIFMSCFNLKGFIFKGRIYILLLFQTLKVFPSIALSDCSSCDPLNELRLYY